MKKKKKKKRRQLDTSEVVRTRTVVYSSSNGADMEGAFIQKQVACQPASQLASLGEKGTFISCSTTIAYVSSEIDGGKTNGGGGSRKRHKKWR